MNTNLTAEEIVNIEKAGRSLEAMPEQRRYLIPALQQVQEILAYLPEQAMYMVAHHFNLSPSEVYGVATFYNQFRFQPPGRHPVKVCMGTACHVKGGGVILEHFERKLDICEGQTTDDREFSIERAACVGCCALAPVALVGDTVHGHMMTSKVEGLLLRIRIDRQKAHGESQHHDRP